MTITVSSEEAQIATKRNQRKMFSFGNRKLPRHTAIFNMTPAETCPADKLGMCQLANSFTCYAKKAERMYKGVLPYRKRQQRYWHDVTAENFVKRLLKEKKGRKIKYLRLNESGDFKSQECVDKAIRIAKLLEEYGITCYMYTARKDLDYSNRGPLVINGSNFMVDNCFKTVYTKGPLPSPYCIADCRKCSMCTKKLSKTILAAHH